jgi:hypothetical protein
MLSCPGEAIPQSSSVIVSRSVSLHRDERFPENSGSKSEDVPWGESFRWLDEGRPDLGHRFSKYRDYSMDTVG